jgi:hypothetical protein
MGISSPTAPSTSPVLRQASDTSPSATASGWKAGARLRIGNPRKRIWPIFGARQPWSWLRHRGEVVMALALGRRGAVAVARRRVLGGSSSRDGALRPAWIRWCVSRPASVMRAWHASSTSNQPSRCHACGLGDHWGFVLAMIWARQVAGGRSSAARQDRGTP